MAQAFHFDLTGIREAAFIDQFADTDQVLFFVGVADLMFELVADVEVVFQGSLTAAGNNRNLAQPSSQCLLNPILNQGLVHYRQHLLGHSLGCRKEARAISGRRKKAFLDHGVP